MCSIKTSQKQVSDAISEFDMLNAFMFCCLLLVNKVMFKRSWTDNGGDHALEARAWSAGRVDKFCGAFDFPGSHAPTTTQGRNFDASFSSFFLLSTRHGNFLCLPGLRSAQLFLRQQTNTLHPHARPHSGSEFKSTKTRDIQTTQAVYVFVPPLSTTRSSGPSQAAALSYIAKTL